MNKLFRRIATLSVGLAMAIGVGVAAGGNREAIPVHATESVYKTSLFGSSYNSQGVQNYTSTWTSTNNGFTVSLTNFNNNNNGWNSVKCGTKSNDSTGTITTSSAIDEKITKVNLGIAAIAYPNSLTSITLFKSSNNSTWNSLGTFTKSTGTQTVTIAAADQATNLYYKLEFVCKSASKNGVIEINQIDFYHEASTPLTGITLSGTEVGGTSPNYTLANIAKSDTSTNHTVSVGLTPTTATDQKVKVEHYDGDSVVDVYSSPVTCTSGTGSFNVRAKGTAVGTERLKIYGNTQTSVIRYLSVTVYDDTKTYWDVTFNSDGGSSTPAVQSVEDGTSFTFPSPGTKTHYSFDGWSSDGGNTLYDAGDESPAVYDDIEYTAYWTEDAKYTVTYSAATPGSGSYSHTNQYGGTYTLLAFASLSGITYDSSTYRFKNYTVGGVNKNPGDTFTLSAATNVTVNFEVKPLEYQVTFGTADAAGQMTDFSNTSFVIPSGVTLDNIQGNLYSNNQNQAASIRFGKSGTTGSFDASITGNYYIVSVTCNLKYYGTDTTATFAVTPNGGSAISKSLTGDWADYTYDVSSAKAKKVTLGTDVSGKRAYISGFTIAYAAQAVLDSVTTSGQTTSFTQDGLFAYGGTLTAHYTQGKADATVTPTAYKYGSSGFNPASEGTVITLGTTLDVAMHNGKYIAVGYTEDNITKWSALYQITVSYAAVSSLSLASSTGKVALNEYFDMSEIGVTILPSNANQGYEWTVLSNTVNDDFEFDADIVAAKDTAGTITLKCTSIADSSKYQTFVLTVSGNPVVTLPNSVTLYTGKTTTVTASVEGGTSPYSYSWSITSGGSYASISSGGSSATVTLSGSAAGSVTLQCSVTDSNSKSDSASVTFSVIASTVTSVNWSASAFDVFSGATIPSNIDDTWEVNYEKNNGDADYITFGDYELYLGSKEITSLPYTFVAADDGEELHVEYGGVSSSSVAVAVTQTINTVTANLTDSWDYTFTAKVWSATGDWTIGEKLWNMSGTDDGSPYFGYDATKGQQFGSGSHPWSDISLQSSAFSGTIDSVTVYTSGAKDIDATVQVSVDGTAYGSAKTITATSTAYTFDLGGESGTISIDWVNSSSKAIYVKEIVVNTVSGSVPISNKVDHKAAQRVAVKFAKAFNDAMDDTEYCTAELDDAWSACASAYSTFLSDCAALEEAHEGEGEYAKNLIRYATAQYSDDSGEACIERAMKTYEICVSKHQLDPFMYDDDGTTPLRSVNISEGFRLFNIQNSSTILIVSIVSLVSIAAVGGYFFLRKKKED